MTKDMNENAYFPDAGSAVPEIEDCSSGIPPAGAVREKGKGGRKTADLQKDPYRQGPPGAGAAAGPLGKEAGTTAAQEEKLLFPDVISMTKYFCDHYRLSMFSYLNSCLRDGSLAKTTGFLFHDKRLNKNSCEFLEFTYWRTERDTFYTDVFLRLSLKTDAGTRDWYGTLIIYCGFSDEEEEEDSVFQELLKSSVRRKGREVLPDDGFFYGVEDLVEGKPNRRDCLLLSAFLVPYYKNVMVDKVAEWILKRYMPEAIWDPEKRDAMELARRMGLQVIFLRLYDREHVASILFFQAGELEVLPKNKPAGTPPSTVRIPARTIVINECHENHNYPQFDVYHECFHYEEHYLFYRLQGLCSNDEKRIRTIEVSAEDTGETAPGSGTDAARQEEPADPAGTAGSGGKGKEAGEKTAEKKTKKKWADPVYFMEKQANRAALGMMMPAEPTCRMILQECAKVRREAASKDGKPLRHTGELYEEVGKELSKVFRVPHFRMRARMIQLGFVEARGSLNYVDRHMIEPFSFDTEAWKEIAHTFVVSGKAVERMIAQNADFRDIMQSGEYIYADGHVVKNDPQYVRLVSDREHGQCLLLTDWANSHVDECCLRFVRVYVQKGLGRYEFGRMYYDSEYIARTKFYVRDFLNREKLGDMDDIKARMLYSERFPRDFTEAFQYLRISGGISMKDMAEKLGMNQMTLKRWIESPMKYRNEDFLTAVALVLKLPDWISRLLFKRASVRLDDDNVRHVALDYILRVQSCDGIRAANEYLEKHDLSPLTV